MGKPSFVIHLINTSFYTYYTYILCVYQIRYTPLEKKIFTDESIQYIVERINKNLKNINEVDNEMSQVIVSELKEIDKQINKQINNIVSAIVSGFMQDEFKTRIEELKE